MCSSQLKKKVVLGDEYDSNLRDVLMQALRDLGAITMDQGRGIGGSQELEKLDVAIGNDQLEVEAETYMGLSISGSAHVVDKIVDEVRARLARRMV